MATRRDAPVTRREAGGRRRPLRNVRRDRRLMSVSALVALVSSGALAGYFVGSEPAPPPAITRDVTASARAGGLTLTLTGDTMLGDGLDPVIDQRGIDWPLAKVKQLLTGDVVLVNAEAPITAAAPPANPGARFSYQTRPESAAALRRAGADVLVLGNNHAMDRGAQGLTETQKHATAAGMTTMGAGADLAEASRPLILTQGERTVAVVSFGENFGPLHRSGEAKPGMVPLTERRVEQARQTAERHGATHLVAVVHWGDNYSPVVDQQRHWAGVFAAAGYDAVVGHGSHTVQEVAMVKGMPVVYGLGNFVFGSPGRYDSFGVPGLGLVAHLSLDEQGGELTFDCIETDNEVVAYQPRPCTPAARQQAAKATGPTVSWPTEGPGTLTW